MVGIEFVRIDDRLIHGQVATTWIKTLKIEQAIVISDALADDRIQKTVLEMAAPEGLKVHLFSTEKFINIYHKNPIKRRTLLIYTNPQEILRCIQGGVEIKRVNIGGMKFTEGKEKLTKAVSVNNEEKEAFKELIRMGIPMEVQMVPVDKAVNITEYIA